MMQQYKTAMSVVVSLLAIWLLGNVALAGETASLSVGVVNVQQILQQSTRVAELRKQLDDQFKERVDKINEDRKTLETAVEKFKKELPTMSEKEKQAARSKITADRAEQLKRIIAYQQAVEHSQELALKNVMHDLVDIISKLAKEKKYSVVLDTQAVVYLADKTGADLTKKVAEQFDGKATR